MALEATLDAGFPARVGKKRMSCGTLKFDSSYPTNGEPITPQLIGFQSRIEAISFIGGMGAGKQIDWDPVNLKLICYTPATGTHAEVTNTTDPGLATARFVAWGW